MRCKWGTSHSLSCFFYSDWDLKSHQRTWCASISVSMYQVWIKVGCKVFWCTETCVFTPYTSLLPASSQPKSESVEHVRLFLGGFGVTVNATHRQQQCTIIYWGVVHHVNTFFCCSAIGFGLGSGIFLKGENLTRVKTSFTGRCYYKFSTICTL